MPKIKSNKAMINAIKRRFKIEGVFDREGIDGNLIISAENGETIGYALLCDYYDALYYDPEEKIYQFGVNKKLLKFVENAGWGIEWENPGALFLYRD